MTTAPTTTYTWSQNYTHHQSVSPKSIKNFRSQFVYFWSHTSSEIVNGKWQPFDSILIRLPYFPSTLDSHVIFFLYFATHFSNCFFNRSTAMFSTVFDFESYRFLLPLIYCRTNSDAAILNSFNSCFFLFHPWMKWIFFSWNLLSPGKTRLCLDSFAVSKRPMFTTNCTDGTRWNAHTIQLNNHTIENVKNELKYDRNVIDEKHTTHQINQLRNIVQNRRYCMRWLNAAILLYILVPTKKNLSPCISSLCSSFSTLTSSSSSSSFVRSFVRSLVRLLVCPMNSFGSKLLDKEARTISWVSVQSNPFDYVCCSSCAFVHVAVRLCWCTQCMSSHVCCRCRCRRCQCTDWGIYVHFVCML